MNSVQEMKSFYPEILCLISILIRLIEPSMIPVQAGKIKLPSESCSIQFLLHFAWKSSDPSLSYIDQHQFKKLSRSHIVFPIFCFIFSGIKSACLKYSTICLHLSCLYFFQEQQTPLFDFDAHLMIYRSTQTQAQNQARPGQDIAVSRLCRPCGNTSHTLLQKVHVLSEDR